MKEVDAEFRKEESRVTSALFISLNFTLFLFVKLKGAQIMDEAVRIYSPSRALIVTRKQVQPDNKKLERARRRKENIEIWREVIAKREAEIRALQKKYPWFNVFYNYLMAACLIALAFSLVWWRLDVNATKRASAEYELRLETFYAEQELKVQEEQAALLAAQNSEAARREAEYNLMAKFLEGINGFVKNRGYSTNDLITYAQCPLNRVLNPTFTCSTLEEAIRQENQWVGFFENNQVTAENYQIAKRVIDDFYDNPVRPCGYEYCWTEFTDHGLYLKSDFGPATFDNTWRYKD